MERKFLENHLNNKETSLNPLGMVHALLSSVSYSVEIDQTNKYDKEKINSFIQTLQIILHEEFAKGNGTKDMKSNGLNNEEFITHIENKIDTFRK